MPEIIKSAETVDGAIALALEEIGKTREQVQIEVVKEPKKAFLGFGGTQAEVKVVYEEDTAESSGTKAAEDITGYHVKTQNAVNYLNTIFTKMDLAEIQLNISESEEGVVIDLTGPNVGTLIGRRGETLDALQYLTSLSANKVSDDYYKITLDSNNYRSKREKTLEGLAKKIAKTAVRTGRSTALEPMNPYERRIIHTAVSEINGAQSKSVGEEPYRKVVISSTNPSKRPYQKRDHRGGNDRRDNRRDNYNKRDNNKRPYEKRQSSEESLRQVKAGVDAAVKSRIFDKIGENDTTPLYTKIDLDEE